MMIGQVLEAIPTGSRSGIRSRCRGRYVSNIKISRIEWTGSVELGHKARRPQEHGANIDKSGPGFAGWQADRLVGWLAGWLLTLLDGVRRGEYRYRKVSCMGGPCFRGPWRGGAGSTRRAKEGKEGQGRPQESALIADWTACQRPSAMIPSAPTSSDLSAHVHSLCCWSESGKRIIRPMGRGGAQVKG